MTKVDLLLVVLTSCLSYVLGQQKTRFADNLATCVADQPINVCLRNTMEELRGVMHVGIPELNLPPSEPFVIPKLDFRTRPGLVKITSTFTNVVVKGLSKFSVQHLNADVPNRVLHIGMRIPRIDVRGLYDIRGSIFLLRVQGDGDFVSALENVRGRGQATFVPVGPPGQQRLTIRDTNIDFDFDSTFVRMNNLFGGRAPDVEREVNEFINENSDLILEEIKPEIKARVNTMVERVVNDALSKIDASDIVNNLESSSRNARGQQRRRH